MSPRPSNRQALIEAALRCIEERPAARITARDIAAAAGANLGSIGYHFGSTELLVAEAFQEGFRRWLADVVSSVGDLSGTEPRERLLHLFESARCSLSRHRGLFNAFLAALARSPNDSELRRVLARSYADSRSSLTSMLGLGDDDPGTLAASLLLAAFDGLLIEAVLAEDLPPTPPHSPPLPSGSPRRFSPNCPFPAHWLWGSITIGAGRRVPGSTFFLPCSHPLRAIFRTRSVTVLTLPSPDRHSRQWQCHRGCR
ncbi:MAG: TetR/AcrR family transcriptional regulator [Solirubrobacterales bacterium]